MRVHLSFDVEVWCSGWDRLDESFPSAFERYVWGRSASGEFALPRNLQILNEHGLVGVFFVEPLFSLRFGARYLDTIVGLIQAAGQDVQLHIHPEWVDEIAPPLIENCLSKRQHLTQYSLAEQTELIRRAAAALGAATGRPVSAFRSGGYSVNRDTYSALAAVGVAIDSSLNATFNHAAGTLGLARRMSACQTIAGVEVHPVSVFKDGTGRLRHMQVGACSFREMRQVLDQAHDNGVQEVVIVSHNFELLQPGSAVPDRVVERRFRALCRHLAQHPDRFTVGPFAPGTIAPDGYDGITTADLRAGLLATGTRFVEQAARRFG